MLSYVAKHSKQRKSTKAIKLRSLASISSQIDQNNANYKRNQITMTCIDLMSKHWKQPKTTKDIKLRWICIDLTSKMLSYVAMNSKQHKTTKVIKLQWLASIWCQNIENNQKLKKWSYYDEFASIWCQKCWVTSPNTQNNPKLKKLIILRWICIYLMSNRSKMLSYVAKHSKQRKSTKAIKLRWIASISSQIDQNNAKVQKRSNYDELHRFHLKSIKTTQITKAIKLQWIASIWRHNDRKCWVTSQCIQNNTKLQK